MEWRTGVETALAQRHRENRIDFRNYLTLTLIIGAGTVASAVMAAIALFRH